MLSPRVVDIALRRSKTCKLSVLVLHQSPRSHATLTFLKKLKRGRHLQRSHWIVLAFMDYFIRGDEGWRPVPEVLTTLAAAHLPVLDYSHCLQGPTRQIDGTVVDEVDQTYG